MVSVAEGVLLVYVEIQSVINGFFHWASLYQVSGANILHVYVLWRRAIWSCFTLLIWRAAILLSRKRPGMRLRWRFAPSAALMMSEVSLFSRTGHGSRSGARVRLLWLVGIVIVLRFIQSFAGPFLLTFEIFLISMAAWPDVRIAPNVCVVFVLFESVVLAECAADLVAYWGASCQIRISRIRDLWIVSIWIWSQITCLRHLKISWSAHF